MENTGQEKHFFAGTGWKRLLALAVSKSREELKHLTLLSSKTMPNNTVSIRKKSDDVCHSPLLWVIISQSYYATLPALPVLS